MAKFLDDIRAGELWAKVKEVVSTAQQAAVSAITSQKNQPNGIAGLDSSGKLQQIPTVEDIGIGAIFLASHPVGSLYETDVPTNPGTLYGGTWAAWGGGSVTVGVNTADTDFRTVGKTGGEKTHTLTIDEMPSHTHELFMRNGSVVNDYYGDPQGGTGADATYRVSAYLANTGGGQAHNNLQPYITTYRWKRTA